MLVSAYRGKEVLLVGVFRIDSLPCDVNHTILDLFIPFVNAEMESERIEPFYKTLHLLSDTFTLNRGKLTRNNNEFDFRGAYAMLLDKTILLDKRVKDGRFSKYLEILESIVNMIWIPYARVPLVRRGMELGSYVALSQLITGVDIDGRKEIASSTMCRFFDAFIERIKNEPGYKESIEFNLYRDNRLLSSLALEECHEEALSLFMGYFKEPFSRKWELSYIESGDKTSETKRLYEKYSGILNHYFTIDFT